MLYEVITDDDVEAADAVRHDDKTPFVGYVAVAHLAGLARAEAVEVGRVESSVAGLLQEMDVDGHGVPRLVMGGGVSRGYNGRNNFV